MKEDIFEKNLDEKKYYSKTPYTELKMNEPTFIEPGLVNTKELAGNRPIQKTPYTELKMNEPTFIEPGVVDTRALRGNIPPRILTEREKIEILLSKVNEILFLRSYQDPEVLIKNCNEMISTLENVFNDNDSDKIQELLGGELSNNGLNNLVNATKKPLYFMIDLYVKALERKKFKSQEINSEIINIIAKMKDLRGKASKLDFRKEFNPENKIYDFTLDKIFNSDGYIDFIIDNQEGVSYLAVITKSYVNDGEMRYVDSSPIPLYELDRERIDNAKYNRTKNNLTRLNALATKYFVDKEIPTTKDFYAKLSDKNIDSRIINLLFSISMLKDNNPFYLGEVANSAIYKIEDIEKLEKIIAEENLKIYSSSFENAKSEYKPKNSLWAVLSKVFNSENRKGK